VCDLYENFGFDLVEKHGESEIWKLDIKFYEIKNKFIGVLND